MSNSQNQCGLHRVVIVGGGTAGWLGAGVLAAKLSEKHSVTLIESPTVSSIGVGEGSWPSLRDTLLDIGINESEFLTLCQGAFKQGSSFVNWRKGGHHYHHPFTIPTGYNELDIHACWQAFASDMPYEDAFSLQSTMCAAGKAPKQIATPDYAHVLNYGYHFDATKLADLLKKHCVNKLSVEHVIGHIASVTSHPNGYIEKVVTECGQEVFGDLFIDCSGNNGLLIDKHFKVPWVPVKCAMLNDRAIALQVPYADNDNEIKSTTVATAQTCGWTWDISLQHRRGTGLVYSSQFTNEEQAKQVLIDYVCERYSDANEHELAFRTLSFEPGYRSKFWVKNCLSLGMSSGFVEPLEASAIAMVELGLRMLCETFPHNKDHMEIVSKRYNTRFEYRWERVIDFLKLHYVLSDREEPYWVAQRSDASIPDSLAELLKLWKYQSPSRLDLIENEEIFPSASYQYVLYGMGFTTLGPPLRLNEKDKRKALHLSETLQQTKNTYLQGLPTNNALLKDISNRYYNEQKHLHSHTQRQDYGNACASSEGDRATNLNNNTSSDKKDTSYGRIGFR
ncbi:tryptophan halogenase family protein [Alteromonas sp. PRIM-21]|uniref:tryptophan halogenase family protein n=1 Tax=Alteromonas sp. PRIM-21 TaxID=1454978 RepID=UPI0022B9BDAE|nr:tryptophan halogenase family protein [Alteromonas sp. PRIM-21]MCZ8530255.1 tryptophan 7-halogenase [Alteromonas sp. PRIM-21]